MKKTQVLLLSGTAGAYTIRGKDIENTIFDEKKSAEIIQKNYIIDGTRIIPQNAFCVIDGKKEYLLRVNRSSYPVLVTRTLEDIISGAGFDFISLPCDTIWNEENVACCCNVVCLSTTFMWSEAMINRAISWITKNIKYDYLVLGGHYSSIKYQHIFDSYPEVDFVIVGDGETALPLLLNKLVYKSSHDYKDIPNLTYLDSSKLVKTKTKYENLENMPKVQYEGHFEKLSYESVRGCAFGCKFCTWDAGIKCFRYKSASKIINDFEEYMNENGIKRIEINDSTFLFPFSRIPELLEGFERLGLHWKAHSRSDVPFDDELIDKLNRSNCDILQIGFESMTDRILNNMSKKTTVEQNRNTNEVLKKTNIDTVVSFIVGFPDETVEEFSNTSNYIINEHWGHFYIFVFEMEDKSLELWNEREKYGFELFEDKEDCLHGGANWTHNGMSSDIAFSLRERLLVDVRKNESMAIYKSWQSPYEWPFIKSRSKEENIKIERLLDNLAFLPKDFSQEQIREQVIRIKRRLEEYGVFFCEKNEVR